MRRPGPGFIALPKASPQFAAAFRDGRPSYQRPYAAEAPKFYSTALKVAGAVVVVFIVFGVVVSLHGQTGCSVSSLHPHRTDVKSAFTASQQRVAAIDAASSGVTPASAAQLQHEHQQLIGDLEAIPLNAQDSAAVLEYASQLQGYDTMVAAALQQSTVDAANAALRQAQAQLSQASQSLDEQLSSVPQRCTNH